MFEREIDVSEILEILETGETIARYDGLRTIGLGINKQSGANTVAIAAEARKRFDELNAILPADMQLGTGDRPIDCQTPACKSPPLGPLCPPRVGVKRPLAGASDGTAPWTTERDGH